MSTFLLLACEPTTGIRVHINSNLDEGSELRAVRVLIRSPSANSTPMEEEIRFDEEIFLGAGGEGSEATWITALPFTIPVAPYVVFAPHQGRWIEVEVQPILDEGACETSGDTIAPVRRVVEFEVGRVIDTELFVHRGCCGVECRREGWSCGTIYGRCSPDDETP